MSTSPIEVDIDVAALRAKYRAERDKRLRPDNINQYKEPSRKVVEDPWTESTPDRDPVNRDVDVLVVGGGMSGLAAGAHLRKSGFEDFCIIEKGADFGGTWYWNRYPGAQCDVESYMYLPFLEETGYMPKERYSYQPEIFEHLQRVGKHFDLYPKALFQTAITSLEWVEEDGRWLVVTDRGDHLKARFVIKTTGVLDKPKFPGISGIDSFKGHMFHTSRWDYGYTGGTTRGGMTGLADKRVAIIGTGATAIQCSSFVAKDAVHLYMIQRTPSSVGLRMNHPTNPEWAKSLKSGWQRERQENFIEVTTFRDVEDMVKDGWTIASTALGGFAMGLAGDNETEDEVEARREIADFKTMNELRGRIESIVKDKATADALKPWFRLFCKRSTYNDDYLDIFNRGNVTLVDTNGHGVDRIDETGFVVDGVHHDVDCIIFATGFEVGTSVSRRSGFEIHGHNGLALSEAWKDGMSTLHGCYSYGFPNLFHMGTGQNASHINRAYPINNQAIHITSVLAAARQRGATYVEADKQAELDWGALIVAGSHATVKFYNECTPGFFNGEGQSTGKELIANIYSPGPIEFVKMLAKWREEGFAGLEFR